MNLKIFNKYKTLIITTCLFLGTSLFGYLSIHSFSVVVFGCLLLSCTEAEINSSLSRIIHFYCYVAAPIIFITMNVKKIDEALKNGWFGISSTIGISAFLFSVIFFGIIKYTKNFSSISKKT